MNVLLTLPDYDPTTHCVSEWNKHLLFPVIEKNKIECHSIAKNNVTKKHIEFTMRDKNPEFLILNGHGTISGDSICGHNNEIIIKSGDNHHLLETRIIHSFTCCSGKVLGEQLKAGAFVGYDDLFIFWRHPHATANPLKDPFASPHMKSALVVPFEILKGKNVKDAYL